MIPMYEPLEVSKCKKSGKVIAEPKEVIRIDKTRVPSQVLSSSSSFVEPMLVT